MCTYCYVCVCVCVRASFASSLFCERCSTNRSPEALCIVLFRLDFKELLDVSSACVDLGFRWRGTFAFTICSDSHSSDKQTEFVLQISSSVDVKTERTLGIMPPVASLCPRAKSSPTRSMNPGILAPYSRSRAMRFAMSQRLSVMFESLRLSSSGNLRSGEERRHENETSEESGLKSVLAHMIITSFVLFRPRVPAHRVAMTGWTDHELPDD